MDPPLGEFRSRERQMTIVSAQLACDRTKKVLL